VADKSLRSFVRLASILSARIIPARGGETEYVSTRLAFARLDAASCNKLQNSFAWHDYAHSRKQIAPDLASPEERAALPPQCWRMAWTNPPRMASTPCIRRPRRPRNSRSLNLAER
jgi:alpha-ketoglutarate-dependent 2,4-dichlorophenoxyacetate dioxygenase